MTLDFDILFETSIILKQIQDLMKKNVNYYFFSKKQLKQLRKTLKYRIRQLDQFTLLYARIYSTDEVVQKQRRELAMCMENLTRFHQEVKILRKKVSSL